MSASFKFIPVVLALLVGTAGLGLLHLENHRLQHRLLADTARAGEAARLRDDNARLVRWLAEHRSGAESARLVANRERERLREEIALFEQKAEQQHAARLAATTGQARATETNRDPRQGSTRLEYFQNQGQATPAAAFQTLVWAALKGDEAALAQTVALNSTVKARAAALIASLPAEDRPKWTPEKLGALWFTGLFTEIPSVHIVGETIVSADEAVVQLRLPSRGEEKLSVRLTPAGWKILVPSAAIDHLKKKVQLGKE